MLYIITEHEIQNCVLINHFIEGIVKEDTEPDIRQDVPIINTSRHAKGGDRPIPEKPSRQVEDLQVSVFEIIDPNFSLVHYFPIIRRLNLAHLEREIRDVMRSVGCAWAKWRRRKVNLEISDYFCVFSRLNSKTF